MSRVWKAIASVLMGLSVLHAQAEMKQWPERPVRIVVAFGAGGAADTNARHLAQKLSELWGKPVTVDNRPGGNTVIAALELARSAPDGYTLMQAVNSTLTINTSAFSKLPYDPLRDFTHIGLVASVPLIVLSNDTLPAKTIPEFVRHAKSHPGEVTFGVVGVGMQIHAERLLRDLGVKVQYVSYRTAADMMKGLLSNDIQMGIDGIVAYPPYLKSGKLRALASNSTERIAALPDVPSISEFGYKDADAPVWHGIVAPAGLAPEVQAKLAADLQKVLAMPDMKTKTAALGIDAAWQGRDRFVELIKTETANFAPVVRSLGVKFD